ncbi:tetratricopeptide repeat protein [Kribbella shirazensis]|uniref:Tetratricopeptide (TPR) repeat protein n=1 Tax=Kribbella shirazensis TaxID=1105143 RepID=A0A7X6A3R4_9ACTN|nr:tetratricopeptide repeat protein [Kribbella shirazensis]NIK60168.1 tetratricopeptide (TPR) repeat protein [Kribbella shirazensis]
MTSLREMYIRGGVQMAATAAVVAGGIGWLAGWRYGHALITLGLALYVCTLFPRRAGRSWHTTLAFYAAKEAAKSYEAGQFEDAAAAVASQVGHLRKLAFIRPDESKYLGNALTAQWNTLTKLGRHADALVVAEEAVAVCRIVDQGRPPLDRALELVECSLSEFPDEPAGASADELLALRSQRADEANRLRARSLAIVAERHLERSEHDAAHPLLEEVTRILRYLGSDEKLVPALTELGHCRTRLREYEQARASYGEALAIAGTLDPVDPEDILGLQMNLAGSARELQQYAEAVRLDEAVVAVLRADHQSESPHEKSLERLTWALTTLGDDLRALHRLEEALAAYSEALELHRAADRPGGVDEALPPVIRTLRALGRPDDARPLEDELSSLRKAPRPGTIYTLRIPTSDEAPSEG